MAETLKLAIWNANGLCQHSQEVKLFLETHKVDVMLISESHFTHNSHLKIPNYVIYNTNHPDGKAHGGSAIIIKRNVKHYELDKYKQDYLQATSISVEDKLGNITISAIYCPPKHNNKREHYQQFFNTLGGKFIAGGDFNAKHQQWGSRLATTKGKELYAVIKNNNMATLSTGQPTHWPSDLNKIPDVIDFCVTNGLNNKKFKIESSLDLSSDHTPILVTLYSEILHKQKQPSLFSKNTNWEIFKATLDEHIHLDVDLKTVEKLENAVEYLTRVIQNSAWFATPDSNTTCIEKAQPVIVKQKIAEKRQARKQFRITRTVQDKNIFNKKTKELKALLLNLKNQSFNEYVSNLSTSEANDYSLWKATKNINRPQQFVPPIRKDNGEWARNDKDKADVFAKHLSTVFKPFPSTLTIDENSEILRNLEAPFQMDLPIKAFKDREVKRVILYDINPKKAPGFDLITGKVLQKLTPKCIKLLTFIYNAVLRLRYFPNQWKVAQIILLPKPGKKPEDVTSYRPISLLPTLSKVFEKLLFKRLKPVLEEKKLIPDHQFGFRGQHSTIEQVHRITKKISNDLENKRYCSAAFLDISQAFDKVWHEGLRYKLKKSLPYHFYEILKSYLSDRHFLVKHQEEYTKLYPISSGVPQGSILGPVLYLLYTADLPTTKSATTATFADDTAVLASHTDPGCASINLQDNLNKIQDWLRKWRMKANETKSIHVTFTTRRETCPPVKLNNCTLPQADDAKYLGMHIDRRLTWRKHIFSKRKQLGKKLTQMYWLIGRTSKLSLENKLALYKSIITPIWTYGIQLWGTASVSNIEILQRFQNKVLRIIVDAPWYVPNNIIHQDLRVTSVQEEIQKFTKRYESRLEDHPNKLANKLMSNTGGIRRLKKFRPSDLSTRFKH